jgi:O-antigen/teichoic acid export membrane protein
LTLGQIISSLSVFLLAVAFANLLPPEVYGKYKLILAIVSILAIATLPEMNTSIARSVANGYDGSLLQALKTRLRFGILSTIGSLGVALYYFLNSNIEFGLIFVLVSIFLPFCESFTSYQSLLSGKKHFDVLTKYLILSQIFCFFVALLTLFLTDSIFIVLCSYFSSWTLVRYIFLKISLKKFVENDREDPGVLTYGKHLSAMNLLSTISNNLDKILLFHFLGPIQVAIYSFATAVPEQIKNVLRNLSTLAAPKFAQTSKEVLQKTIWKKIWLYMILLALINAAYIFVAPFIFGIFFPTYTEAIFPSQIFSTSIITLALLIPISILQAHQETKALYWFNISFAATKIISTVILVSFFGLFGAVLAWVGSRFFGLILSLILLKRALSQRVV